MYKPPFISSTPNRFRVRPKQKINQDAPLKANLYWENDDGIYDEGELLKPSVITERPKHTVYTRYFVNYLAEDRIFELDSRTYNEVERDREGYRAYKTFTIEWDGNQPLQTIMVSGYLRLGVNWKNYRTVLSKLKEYPSLFDIVVNDSTLLTTVYTPKGELKDRQGIEYRGEYELTREGDIYSIPGDYGNQGRKKLYPIDKIFTEFDR